MYEMLDMGEALAKVLGEAAPLEVVEKPLQSLVGFVLAEDVAAPIAHPPFRAAISDGYAVRASATGASYRVAFSVLAGRRPDRGLAQGECCYVATGAPLPEGADAVRKHEDAIVSADGVWLPATPEGTDVRLAGSDHAEGDVLLATGTRLRPADLGILATAGRTAARVYRRPVVVVLSTGDELATTSYDPECMVYDANRASLLALLGGNGDAYDGGAHVVDGGIVADDATALETALDRISADVIVTTGGVSTGRADFAKGVLEKRGTVHFGRLHMKPGKPTTFATLDSGTLVFGLPGNPVSAVVTAHLLVLPCLKRLRGVDLADCLPAQVVCELADDVKLDPVRPEYRRVVLDARGPNGQYEALSTDDRFVGTGTGLQRSSRLVSMRGAHALACLPEQARARTLIGRDAATLPKGTKVHALLIAPLPPRRSEPFFSVAVSRPSIHYGLIGARDVVDPVYRALRSVKRTTVVDDLDLDHVLRFIDAADHEVVAVCGGISLRDTVGHALHRSCRRLAPGLSRAMARALDDPLQSPFAALRHGTLVLALPDDPTLALRCIRAIQPALDRIEAERV